MNEESTVVAICLGSSPDREKRNPEEAAMNICKIADQILEQVFYSSVIYSFILNPILGFSLYCPRPCSCAGRRGQRGSIFFLLEFTGKI